MESQSLLTIEEKIQAIIAARYGIYRDEIIESMLRDARSIEEGMLMAYVSRCRTANSMSEISAYARDVLPLRTMEVAVSQRRRAMDRLALDGPGNWLST